MQHLNRNGEPVTLCGRLFDEPEVGAVYDHRDGFDPRHGSTCDACADAADKLQNGLDFMHLPAELSSGSIPAHYPGAYPSLSCCGGPVRLVKGS